MQLFSVKKCLTLRIFTLNFLFSCVLGLYSFEQVNAAYVHVVNGFPYRPLLDLAVTAQRKGVKTVFAQLTQPPVVYPAVAAGVSSVLWAYCEYQLWKLKRQRDTTAKAYAQCCAQKIDHQHTRQMRKAAGKEFQQAWTRYGRREWMLWLTKWGSFGLSSLAFTSIYKFWPKSEIYAKTFRL
jgi:hypothetical protein